MCHVVAQVKPGGDALLVKLVVDASLRQFCVERIGSLGNLIVASRTLRTALCPSEFPARLFRHV
jgi:hypothetical protein